MKMERYTNFISKFDVREMNFESRKKTIGHKLLLPQEVVRHEVWTSGLYRKHSYR